VHENNPQTIGELKAAITAKIREIPKEIWWTYVGLINIFRGSVFFGSPCNCYL
jgi:hypothetical protein